MKSSVDIIGLYHSFAVSESTELQGIQLLACIEESLSWTIFFLVKNIGVMFYSWLKKTKKFLFHKDDLNLINRQVLINGVIHGDRQRFLFKKRIGSGAFGAVYEAITPTGQRVAVKVTNLLPAYPRTAEYNMSYFNRYWDVCEGEFLKLMDLSTDKKQRHVVKVYEFGVDINPEVRPYVYMVMELGDENLHDIVTNLHEQYKQIYGVNCSNEYISPHDRRILWKELIEIVATLERNDISHMDLKPANIVRFSNLLKVCDLGISQYGSGVGGGGTPNFSPPEALIMNGQHHPKVDIWSLGAILYYMTYGREPNWNPGNRNWEPPYGYCPVKDPFVQDLLMKTLQYKMEHRPDISALMQHPYTSFP